MSENETNRENENETGRKTWMRRNWKAALIAGSVLLFGTIGVITQPETPTSQPKPKTTTVAQAASKAGPTTAGTTNDEQRATTCSWYSKYGKSFIVAECEALWNQPGYVDEVNEGRQTVTAAGPTLVAVCSTDPDVFSECAEYWQAEYAKHLAKRQGN